MVKKKVLFLLAMSSFAFASQDPTAPLNWQQAPKTGQVKKVVHYRVPNLQSIVCGGNKECYAILDGQAMAKGEKIDGFSVKQIQADYVTVTRGSKQWKLELFPLEVKQ
ncbi:MAG TPA: MSHA biogenesis protein MshK [Vibrio sp.]|nr:MSHA biogenesis protein MshK [Vibrio sp.]